MPAPSNCRRSQTSIHMHACFAATLLLAMNSSCSHEAWDEPIYLASRQVNAGWHVGESPTVLIDFKHGTRVTVTSGIKGEVAAVFTIHTPSKISQAVADERVRVSPGATFEKEGDIIRIIESPSNRAGVSLELRIPPDCYLDIRSVRARIDVGGPSSEQSQGQPIPIARLAVATERNLTVHVKDSSSGPPVLDLEGSSILLTVNGVNVPVTTHFNYTTGESTAKYKSDR